MSETCFVLKTAGGKNKTKFNEKIPEFFVVNDSMN